MKACTDQSTVQQRTESGWRMSFQSIIRPQPQPTCRPALRPSHGSIYFIADRSTMKVLLFGNYPQITDSITKIPMPPFSPSLYIHGNIVSMLLCLRGNALALYG